VAQARLSMRKISEILRLKAERFSDRQIAAAISSSRSTVQECLRRCRAAGIGWPMPTGLDEAGLMARLYQRTAPARQPIIDFAHIHGELKRPGVTRDLLWQEYKAREPQGLQYTAFCNHYRRWLARQELVLRQEHLPGDKAFVDYAGHTVPVVDRLTGEVRPAQIFIAVLGCSNPEAAHCSGTPGTDISRAGALRAQDPVLGWNDAYRAGTAGTAGSDGTAGRIGTATADAPDEVSWGVRPAQPAACSSDLGAPGRGKQRAGRGSVYR
jgi:hypothetical protein